MAKLKTNESRLVKIGVQGRTANALQFNDAEFAHDGTLFALPSTGGIVYNVKTGDNCFEWEGDHIEPGVSAVLKEDTRNSKANMGFNFLACVGNLVRVVSGDAKGRRGVVTGHHGGIEQVMLDFDDDTLSKLNLEDKFLIEAYGQGLQLLDYPSVKVYSLDPALLHQLPVRELRGGKLSVGVTTIVPAALMGSGLGHNNLGTGDCDIMTHDAGEVKRLKLDQMCFGDLIAVTDHDHSYGRTFRKGAVTIGVIIHGNSRLAGHGPGISTLLTCAKSDLVPEINAGANIAKILKIGRYRTKKK